MKYRHLKNKFGLCDFEKKEITIDVVSLIESTIIHEMAHAIHPDWSEKKVLSYEKRRYPKLSLRQKKELIKRFSTIKEEK